MDNDKFEQGQKTTLSGYFYLAIATFGVGYIPLAPGTWGSACGVLIYLLVRQLEANYIGNPGFNSSPNEPTLVWVYTINSLLLFMFCSLGIFASTQASKIFKKKDPSEVVVDEVMGQLITFLFVPFIISGWFIFLGFLFFRIFDIWKPYPIDLLQDLPGGLGVCVDDILAGVYAGLCLSLLYAISLAF